MKRCSFSKTQTYYAACYQSRYSILKSIKKRSALFCENVLGYAFWGLLPKTSYLILNKTIYNKILTCTRTRRYKRRSVTTKYIGFATLLLWSV